MKKEENGRWEGKGGGGGEARWHRPACIVQRP